MIKLDILRSRLLKNLERYPLTNEFFGELLIERMDHGDGWLEIRLVLLLLKAESYRDNLEHIEAMLKIVSEHSGVLQDIRSTLNPTEVDFDGKVGDALAEVSGACFLHNNGFRNIQKMPEMGEPVPDFQGEREGLTCIAEVKHLRAPLDLATLSLKMLEVQRLLYPDVFDQGCSISVPHHESRGSEEGKLLRDFFNKARTKWLTNPCTPICQTYSLDMGSGCRDIRIQMRQVPRGTSRDRAPDIAGDSEGTLCLSDDRYHKRLVSKTDHAIAQARRQLDAYDGCINGVRLILVNWDPSGEYIISGVLSASYKSWFQMRAKELALESNPIGLVLI